MLHMSLSYFTENESPDTAEIHFVTVGTMATVVRRPPDLSKEGYAPKVVLRCFLGQLVNHSTDHTLHFGKGVLIQAFTHAHL